MEKNYPELCTRLREEYYKVDKQPAPDVSSHHTLMKLINGDRWVSPFARANMRNVAEATLALYGSSYRSSNIRPVTYMEAVQDLRVVGKASGPPYYTDKESALLQNHGAISRDTIAIYESRWDSLLNPPFGQVSKKVSEILPVSKQPKWEDGELCDPGKERNIIVFPLAPLLAYKMMTKEAIDHQVANWATHPNKVGCGKADMPLIYLTLQGQHYTYAAFDVVGMEIALHQDWYDVPAHLLAAQCGHNNPRATFEWFRDYYRTFVSGSWVVCECGLVFEIDGGQRSGFGGTVNTNGEIVHNCLVQASYITDHHIDPAVERVVAVSDWIAHMRQFQTAVVGDDSLMSGARPKEYWGAMATNAERLSSLKFKVETEPQNTPWGLPFLSSTVDEPRFGPHSVQPEKLLASLYFSTLPADLVGYAVASARLDCRETWAEPVLRVIEADLEKMGYFTLPRSKTEIDEIMNPGWQAQSRCLNPIGAGLNSVLHASEEKQVHWTFAPGPGQSRKTGMESYPQGAQGPEKGQEGQGQGQGASQGFRADEAARSPREHSAAHWFRRPDHDFGQVAAGLRQARWEGWRQLHAILCTSGPLWLRQWSDSWQRGDFLPRDDRKVHSTFDDRAGLVTQHTWLGSGEVRPDALVELPTGLCGDSVRKVQDATFEVPLRSLYGHHGQCACDVGGFLPGSRHRLYGVQECWNFCAQYHPERVQRHLLSGVAEIHVDCGSQTRVAGDKPGFRRRLIRGNRRESLRRCFKLPRAPLLWHAGGRDRLHQFRRCGHPRRLHLRRGRSGVQRAFTSDRQLDGAHGGWAQNGQAQAMRPEGRSEDGRSCYHPGPPGNAGSHSTSGYVPRGADRPPHKTTVRVVRRRSSSRRPRGSQVPNLSVPNAVYMLKDCQQNFQAGKRTGDTILDVYWMTATESSGTPLDSYTLAGPTANSRQRYFWYSEDTVESYFTAAYTVAGTTVDTMVYDTDVIINPQKNRAVHVGSSPNVGLMWNYAVNPQYSPVLAAIAAATDPKNVLFRAEGQVNPQLCKEAAVPVMNHADWTHTGNHPVNITTARKLVYSESKSRTLAIDGFIAQDDFSGGNSRYTGRFC